MLIAGFFFRSFVKYVLSASKNFLCDVLKLNSNFNFFPIDLTWDFLGPAIGSHKNFEV